MPLEVVFPSPAVDGDLAFGEFILDPNNMTIMRTNYADYNVSDNDLRSLGLSLLVSASCGVHGGKFRRDWHLRFPWTIHPGRRLDPVFQTCTCVVARELGFYARAVHNYGRILDFWIIRDIGISTSLKPAEYQGLFSRVFLDQSRNDLHMFSFGDLTSASVLSRFTWNSKKIEPIPEALRKKLIELDDNLAASDMQCIGITYKPVMSERAGIPQFKDYPHLVDFTAITEGALDSNIVALARHQIFLGAIISGYVPKKDMQELIDDLENSGIRFVYFSPYSESVTKAFGDRLGLETDWNSCIILSKGKGLDVNDFTDPKSKLPRGVHNIRPHLANVDDIPLHLSLFAESDPLSVSEMHAIYRENDEFVVTVGSTLNWANSKVFSSAQLSIGMEPPNLRAETPSGKVSSMALSASLSSLTCPFVLPFDCSPYVLTEIIREARNLARGSISVIYFSYSAAITIILLSLSGCPSSLIIVSPLPIIFVTIISFLFGPYEPNILKLMPHRPYNPENSRSLLILHSSRGIINGLISGIVIRLIRKEYSVVGVAFLMAGICLTTLHTHLPIYQFGLAEHKIWTILTLAVLIVYTIGVLVTNRYHCFRELLVLFIQVAAASAVTVSINEAIKFYWHLEAERSEKRAKLQFNTKLGMHSPV